MKIEFKDQGSDSVITVTSTVFEFRRHNRAVDVALLLTTEMTSQRSGFFIMKTILSGKTHHVLRAYKHLLREAKVMDWPTAFCTVGCAFAIAWCLRS